LDKFYENNRVIKGSTDPDTKVYLTNKEDSVRTAETRSDGMGDFFIEVLTETVKGNSLYVVAENESGKSEIVETQVVGKDSVEIEETPKSEADSSEDSRDEMPRIRVIQPLLILYQIIVCLRVRESQIILLNHQ
jgi:hypothetical protein